MTGFACPPKEEFEICAKKMELEEDDDDNSSYFLDSQSLRSLMVDSVGTTLTLEDLVVQQPEYNVPQYNVAPSTADLVSSSAVALDSSSAVVVVAPSTASFSSSTSSTDPCISTHFDSYEELKNFVKGSCIGFDRTK